MDQGGEKYDTEHPEWRLGNERGGGGSGRGSLSFALECFFPFLFFFCERGHSHTHTYTQLISWDGAQEGKGPPDG